MIILKGRVPPRATAKHSQKKKKEKRKLSMPVLKKEKPKLVLSGLIVSWGEGWVGS